MSFVDLTKPEGLKALDDYIASKNVIQGYIPTTLDVQAFLLLGKAPAAQYTHALRYYNSIASYTDEQRKSFRQGGDVPAQLAGSVKAPAVAGAAAPAAAKQAEKPKEEKKQEKQEKPKEEKKQAAPAAAPAAASASPAKLQELEAAVKTQGDLVRQLKTDKAEKSKVDEAVAKLVALKKEFTESGGVLSQPAPQPAKEEKKDAGKKDAGKKEEAKKEEPKKEESKKEGGKKDKKGGKPEAAAAEQKPAEGGAQKYDDKLVKAVEKEGGKKGQDIVGVYEMGGLEFFCTSVDTPNGDLELVEKCLNAMNVEIDPTSEEKRGGAAPVGKMIFSAGDAQLAMAARVPADKIGKVDAGEWMKHVVTKIQGQMVGTPSAEHAQAVVPLNKEKGRFPLKMKEEAIGYGVEYLKSKGCFPDRDDGSDDDVCYGDDDFDM